MKRIALALLAAVAAVPTVAAAAEPFAVQKTIHIGGPGRWDYASVDPAAKRLYVTRTTHTQAIDLTTDQVLFDVPGQLGSHGVVVVPAVGRGFVSDGKAGTLVAFDLKTGAVLATVAAAEDADGAIYDAGTNKVLSSCGDAGKLVVLDASADPKSVHADTVDLGGKPEFLAADGKGMAYVCVNDKNEIAAVDLKALKVTARYPTGTGTAPTGLAIDAEHGRLFVGCRNSKMIVMNAADGKVLAELPIGSGNDACGFDPGTGEAFASGGNGELSVVREPAPGTFAVEQTVVTPKGARTLAVDPTTHVLYLPTAEMNPLKPGERRATVKPNTFMVAVVARPTGK